MWKKNEDSWKWISNGSRSRSSLVQTNLTYEELVEHIYEVTEIDRNLFDIELTYKITTMVEIEPIAIKKIVETLLVSLHGKSVILFHYVWV